MIVIAPHPDDELIGCWSVISSGQVTDVFYCFDFDQGRMAEAEACASIFGFIPHFGSPSQEELIKRNKPLLLPAITDAHPQHKEINRQYRSLGLPTKFYSVDLDHNQKTLLSTRDLKLQALNEIYVSQKSLWQNNASYWLFENIQATDYSINRKYDVIIRRDPELGIAPFAISVYCDIEAHQRHFKSPQHLVDYLITAGATSFEFEFNHRKYTL